MRRIFSTVLVFMLILRGLLGDAMAMGIMPVGAAESAVHHAPVVPQVSTHHEGMDHLAVDMLAETHGVSAQGHCASDQPASVTLCGANGEHHTKSCSACDICNSSLHTAAELVLASAPAPQSLVIERSSRFVSALPAQVVKPPIS